MIELPPDVEHHLREEAARSGQKIDEYIQWLIERGESRQRPAATLHSESGR